jgi:hypothetical protein
MSKETDIISIAAVGLAAILLWDKIKNVLSPSSVVTAATSGGLFPGGTNLGTSLSATGKQGGDVITGVIDGYNNLIAPLDNAEKNIISGLGQSLSKYTDFLDGLVKSETSFASGAISEMKGTINAVTAFDTAVIQGFDDVAKPVLNAGSQALGSIVSITDHALGTASSVSDQSLQAVVKTAGSISDAILKASNNTGNSILQTANDLTSKVIPGGAQSEIVKVVSESLPSKVVASVSPSDIISSGVGSLTDVISNVENLVTALPNNLSKYYTAVYNPETNTTKMILNSGVIPENAVKKSEEYITPLTGLAKVNNTIGTGQLEVSSVSGTSKSNAQNITDNFKVGLDLINSLSNNSSNNNNVSKNTYSSGWTSSGIRESKFTNVIKVK